MAFQILAIDPGPIESAYVVWDGTKIERFAKAENALVLDEISLCGKFKELIAPQVLVIEQVKSYGMTVGASVFETVFWSGRFTMACEYNEFSFLTWDRIPRMDVKMHLCHSSRAKDSNIIQALVDRFAPNEKNRGKGTKSAPGFFYGFKSDIWQAFALAVTYFDQSKWRDE